MTEQFKRKRKLLAILPVIALPFISLMFWSLGGGKGSNQPVTAKTNGLNTKLPDAKLTGDDKDKLSLYDQALKDSMDLEDARNGDPYGRYGMQQQQFTDSVRYTGSTNPLQPNYPPYSSTTSSSTSGSGMAMTATDATEARLRSRLAELENQLQRQSMQQQQPSGYEPPYDESRQIDELQASLQAGTLPVTASEPDPELDKINSVLEKVMDIQHPERARDRLKAESEKHKGLVYAVTAPPDNNSADFFSGGSKSLAKAGSRDTTTPTPKVITAAFYELTDNPGPDNEANKAIPAVVHETQTLTSGTTIKMRLIEDVYINGVLIPKGNYVFGTCQLEGERMNIEVKAIRYKNALFPVSLTVYDMDGITGIKIPGAISRDVTKQGTDQVVQSLDFPMLDPSIGAQAASAGIQTVKSLAGRKAKLIKAVVKAGYPVLLMDLNKRNQ